MDALEEYGQAVEEKWQVGYEKLAKVLQENVPKEFELTMQYGMPTYVVPLAIFPEGYLHRKDEPLPFISLGVQKRHIALYHMGIMGNQELLRWFQQEYKEQITTKLNMGKSCIRFTNEKHIPYKLIGELVGKMSMQQWLEAYKKYTAKR